MSGPIVRKYGFPNFEKIFGERPLEHGADEPETSTPTEAKVKKSKAEKAPAKEPKKSKKSK